MYNLGENFKLNYELSKMNEDAIFKGNKYRITILKPSLIRFEYSENGVFNDAPTELIWYRNFEKPEFTVKEDSKYLQITTKYVKITYLKEKPMIGTKLNPMVNLKVELLNSERLWSVNYTEVRNFKAPASKLDDTGSFEKGLYSASGMASIDDSKGRIFNEDGTVKENDLNNTDVYLFAYLNDFDVCLKDYYDLTGYPALIPRYALGNWWSKNHNYNDLELKQLVDTFGKKGIPLSVILLDKDWHLRAKVGKDYLETGFTFNKDNFKAPYEMISYLHTRGIRLGLSINPFEGFYPVDEYYDRAKNYLQPLENGQIPFNVFDPKTVDVYLKLFIHPLDALGVDFFWVDYFDKKKKDELALLKHYQLYDMMRNYKRRPMLLGYNASLAPHRYPVLYSGKTVVSWDTLKLIPFYNAAAANVGATWWSHDIGGYFKGTEDNELYIRYVQLGVFSPILRFGSDVGKYYKREPWRWSIKTYAIVQDYLVLRHKLIPYLYSEAYKYSKEGVPIIQPLYYKYKDYYDDPLYRDEYYFGSQLFIAPIVKKKDYVMNRVIHKFFIPDGMWYDFVTGKKFPGGRSYVSFFKDQDYPVFAKAGSIIPLGTNETLNDTNPPKNMEIHVFPGRSNTYTLYEDDGVSDLYKKDFYLLSTIDYNYLPNNYTIIIRAVEGKSGIVPETRNYKIIFRNTKKADSVVAYQNKDQIEVTSYTDGPDFIVEAKDVKTIGQLTINCRGKDIEIDAVRLINQDIESIISDLQIETEQKEKIDEVLFSDQPIKKKRIAIRKLGNKGLERKFVKLFLKLLEYIEQV